MSTAWTWTFQDAEGKELADREKLGGGPFPSQGDAESWIGEEWRALADAGVESVTLHEDGTVVYGPMSLRPAE
ncbi:hypothetical protein [Segeticoccus rhizosphaerae]|jgi:hypothetical protein|uniref:hypothetical protein n=1 Tax=Segeticoccus rhizosphaerae TaxID=1104777 RepID=UPI0010C1072D|nr:MULTISPECIES: hypothetical protein [Intrasporangiaceae]